MEITMHTQITLDDQLIQQAAKLTGLDNLQAIIEIALRELITRKKSDPLAKAFGQYCWEGDLEKMRNDQCC
jgi:Arc/MetJ family transcription regulator